MKTSSQVKPSDSFQPYVSAMKMKVPMKSAIKSSVVLIGLADRPGTEVEPTCSSESFESGVRRKSFSGTPRRRRRARARA